MSRFNDYLTFTAIVENQSITGAANQLHRSVSAVSKQLSKLEDSLGVRLIERSTQSLSITKLGEVFYHKCKDILAVVAEAEQSLKDEQAAPSGKITLSFPEVLLRSPFMDLLSAFSNLYPEITLDLRVSNQVEDIIENRIDFAFRMGLLSDSRLTAISLNQARPVFCASPEYLSKKGSPNSFEALFSEHRFILPTYLNLSEQVRRLLTHTDKLPISLEHAHTSNSETVLYDAVVRGLGIAIMLDVSIADDIKAGRLIELFPENPLPTQKMFMLYHNKDYMPEKMRVFKAFIKANFTPYFDAT